MLPSKKINTDILLNANVELYLLAYYSFNVAMGECALAHEL